MLMSHDCNTMAVGAGGRWVCHALTGRDPGDGDDLLGEGPQLISESAGLAERQQKAWNVAESPGC
jgi:hypothetical protein